MRVASGLTLVLLLVGCSLFSAPDNKKGQMFFYTADSTGTERYSFHVNEPIFLHFTIINPTNHDIPYKKIPYMNDNEIFSYVLYTPGQEPDHIAIGYPPQNLQETFLPKHQSREQVYKIEGLEANEYGVRLNLTIFVNPNDFNRSNKPELHFKVDNSYALDIRYFACDLTGVEKTLFKADEIMYFGCTVKNVSDQPVRYLKMQFNSRKASSFQKEMFYVECLKDDGTRPEVGVYEDSPPPGTKWVEFTLKPNETLSQTTHYYPPEKLQPGAYRAWFTLNYIFKDVTSNLQDEMSNTIRIEIEKDKQD